MNVIFYQKADGTEPAREFLLSLDNRLRAKTARTIALLETNGYALREPFSKYLGNGIFELRVRLSTSHVRVLYFFIVGDTAVLTNGFIKKTSKTPRQELELAATYRLDFISKNQEIL